MFTSFTMCGNSLTLASLPLTIKETDVNAQLDTFISNGGLFNVFVIKVLLYANSLNSLHSDGKSTNVIKLGPHQQVRIDDNDNSVTFNTSTYDEVRDFYENMTMTLFYTSNFDVFRVTEYEVARVFPA